MPSLRTLLPLAAATAAGAGRASGQTVRASMVGRIDSLVMVPVAGHQTARASVVVTPILSRQ